MREAQCASVVKIVEESRSYAALQPLIHPNA